MSDVSTDIEVKAEQLLDRLIDDLFRLHYDWDNFIFLFATDEKHVHVLNAVAGAFFERMQRLMFIDVLLQISRITDPASVKGKPTASLSQMLAATRWQESDRARWSRFATQLQKTIQACEPCRQHRNVNVAHKSLHAQALPPATRKMVDDAIAAIQEFVDALALEFGHGSMLWISDSDDSEKLMRNLTNRRSQKRADLVGIIVHGEGDHAAEFQCEFCGQRDSFAYYPDSEPRPEDVARLHYAGCDGVVGFETIKLVAVERNHATPQRTFTLNLSLRSSNSTS